MNDGPFACIGLVNPKSPENVGMVLRAAGCYGAASVLYTGRRYARAQKFHTDTKQVHTQISILGVEDLVASAPAGAKIIGVELIEGALPLFDFVHPPQALYIFGPEDGSLQQSLLNACDAVVYIPTLGCMNLAASVNVLLYDRLAKNQGTSVADRPIDKNRDRNSRGQWLGGI